MTHGGGYAQKQRVKSEWLTRVPEAFSLKQAMAVGTAGYTAMLCILDLERMGVIGVMVEGYRRGRSL